MTARNIALVLVLGCQPPEPPPFITEADAVPAITDATCSTSFACACPLLPWPDEETCRERVAQTTGDTAMVATQAGLRYDGVCVARRLDRIERIECMAEDIDEERDVACAEACKAYVGTIGEGETCQRFGVTVDLDDCAQGLRCSDDRTCVPLCEVVEPVAEGDPCMAGIVVVGECDAGLFCDPVDGLCRAAAKVGEPCDELSCAADAFCEVAPPPRLCVPRFAAGQPCSVATKCASGLCIEEVCAPIVPLVCTL